MIRIETDEMRTMSAIVERANGEIGTAVELLNSVTTHNDWACWERASINEEILQCKTMVRGLLQDSQAFTRTIVQVMEELLETEASIGRLFENVEDLLREALCVLVPVPAFAAPVTENIHPFLNSRRHTGHVLEPSPVIDFSTLKL